MLELQGSIRLVRVNRPIAVLWDGGLGLEVVKAGDRVPAYRGIAGRRYAREVALVGRAIERVQRRTEAFS